MCSGTVRFPDSIMERYVSEIFIALAMNFFFKPLPVMQARRLATTSGFVQAVLFAFAILIFV